MELTLESLENNPYQNLTDYLGNEVTRKVYLRVLKRFLDVIPKEIFEKNLGKSGETLPELATLFVELAEKDIGLVKQIIHAYVRELKNKQNDKKAKKKIKNSYIKNQLKPIVTLLDANEIDFSWKLINKGIPKAELSKDRAYTREELQTLMLTACDIVDKIIVVLFSEEYWTHGTPEAEKILWLYREDWKKRFGKYPEKSDPLIVSVRIREMTRLSSGGVAGRVRKLLARSGLKGINVQADTGFRKYFNTMCRRAKVFEEDREDMMGHYEGLQKHYERYVVEDFERFPEYQKAISILTIDDAERQAIELLALKEEKDKLKLQVNENIKLQAMINAEREARITSQNEIKQMLAKLRDDKLKNFKD